jgi:hypothetical protein
MKQGGCDYEQGNTDYKELDVQRLFDKVNVKMRKADAAGPTAGDATNRADAGQGAPGQ